MERDILNKLKQWKVGARRKPMVIQGARQVGKTWVMREFGRRDSLAPLEYNDGLWNIPLYLIARAGGIVPSSCCHAKS